VQLKGWWRHKIGIRPWWWLTLTLFPPLATLRVTIRSNKRGRGRGGGTTHRSLKLTGWDSMTAHGPSVQSFQDMRLSDKLHKCAGLYHTLRLPGNKLKRWYPPAPANIQQHLQAI
jgi:hypothetical protein